MNAFKNNSSLKLICAGTDIPGLTANGNANLRGKVWSMWQNFGTLQITRAAYSFVLAEAVALKICYNHREVNCSNQEGMWLMREQYIYIYNMRSWN